MKAKGLAVVAEASEYKRRAKSLATIPADFYEDIGKILDEDLVKAVKEDIASIVEHITMGSDAALSADRCLREHVSAQHSVLEYYKLLSLSLLLSRPSPVAPRVPRGLCPPGVPQGVLGRSGGLQRQ